MKKFIAEFKAFALRGNVMDMAVGVIIGSASLTDNFINPLLDFLMGHAAYTWADISGFASAFLSSIVNFFLMAFILFCLIKIINKAMSLGSKKEEKTPAAPTTKICPYCKSEIPIDATKCAHCTSDVD